jgi:hypothetical protein
MKWLLCIRHGTLLLNEPEIFEVVSNKESVAHCDITSCTLVEEDRRLRADCCLLRQDGWAHSSAVMMEAAGSSGKSVSHTEDSNRRNPAKVSYFTCDRTCKLRKSVFSNSISAKVGLE